MQEFIEKYLWKIIMISFFIGAFWFKLDNVENRVANIERGLGIGQIKIVQTK